MLSLKRPGGVELAQRALRALDLTCLEPEADRARLLALCRSARTPFGAPAALCVFPEWVASCRTELDALGLAQVRVATVGNFPRGWNDPERAEAEARRALAAGADELDLVFPYRAFLAGNRAGAAALVRACKQVCGARPLKLILETSAFPTPEAIRDAAELGLGSGADFLKTSTGADGAHATLDAARALLEVIRAHDGAGLKISGGLRRLTDVAPYFALADELMGPDWAAPERFRVGASRLLQEILDVLDAAGGQAQP